MCVQEEGSTRTAKNTLGCENSALWTTWGSHEVQGPSFPLMPLSEVWTLSSSFVPPRTGAAQWRACGLTGFIAGKMSRCCDAQVHFLL